MRRVFFLGILGPILLFSKEIFEIEPFANGVISILSPQSLAEVDLPETKNIKWFVLDLRGEIDGSCIEAMQVVEIFSKQSAVPKKEEKRPMVVLVPNEIKGPLELFCRVMEDKGLALIMRDTLQVPPPLMVEVPTGLETLFQSQVLSVWHKMIGQLTQNSVLRKENDLNWQRVAAGQSDGCGVEDLERREAINVVKDMIFLAR